MRLQLCDADGVATTKLSKQFVQKAIATALTPSRADRATGLAAATAFSTSGITTTASTAEQALAAGQSDRRHADGFAFCIPALFFHLDCLAFWLTDQTA